MNKKKFEDAMIKDPDGIMSDFVHIEILFEDENGKIKKRLIMLPGSLNGGQNETDLAVQIMREEQLLN